MHKQRLFVIPAVLHGWKLAIICILLGHHQAPSGTIVMFACLFHHVMSHSGCCGGLLTRCCTVVISIRVLLVGPCCRGLCRQSCRAGVECWCFWLTVSPTQGRACCMLLLLGCGGGHSTAHMPCACMRTQQGGPLYRGCACIQAVLALSSGVCG